MYLLRQIIAIYNKFNYLQLLNLMFFSCCQIMNLQYHALIFPHKKQSRQSKRCFLRLLNANNKLEQTIEASKQHKKGESSDQLVIEQIIKDKFEGESPKIMLQIRREQICRILLMPISMYKMQKGTYCIKMIKKSNYQCLVEEYRSKANKWTDPDFKPQPHSIIQDNIPNLNLSWKSLQFISQGEGKQVSFIDKFIEPTDIVQSSELGDCYFLSAIAGLAKQPSRVLKLFASIEINPNGIYMARLVFKGILQEVVVDQLFPYNLQTKQLYGCRPCKNQSQIYVMVLEKCWAKLWGSYSKIDGGLTRESLRALSGGALTKTYFLQSQVNSNKGSQFFNQILEFNTKNFIMCVGTDKKGTVKITHKIHGVVKIEIEAGHIYLVQNVILEANIKKVKIYNPWGHNLIAGTNTQINGELKIEWKDFTKSFYQLTASKIHDKANYLYIELEGCMRNKFKFIELIADNDTPCYYGIAVSETDKKEKHSFAVNKYICVNFIGLKYHQGDEYELVSMKSSYEYSDHYFQFNQLTKGKYLIAIYFTQVDINEKLTFSVYSQASFGFKEIFFNAQFQKRFLPRTFLNYYHKNSQHLITKYPDPNNKSLWVSFQAMIQNTVFGYYLIHVGEQSTASFKVQMSNNQFDYINLALLPPYDKEIVQIRATPGHQTIVVFIAKDFYGYKKVDGDYYFNNKRHVYQDLVFGQTIYNS